MIRWRACRLRLNPSNSRLRRAFCRRGGRKHTVRDRRHRCVGVTFDSVPFGPLVVVTLLAVILRRLIAEDMRGERSDFTLHFRKFEISQG